MPWRLNVVLNVYFNIPRNSAKPLILQEDEVLTTHRRPHRIAAGPINQPGKSQLMPACGTEKEIPFGTTSRDYRLEVWFLAAQMSFRKASTWISQISWLRSSPSIDHPMMFCLQTRGRRGRNPPGPRQRDPVRAFLIATWK